MRRFDDLPAMVLVLDGAGLALHVNRRLAAFIGLEAQAATGRGWLDALDAQSREALRRKLAPECDFTLELRMRRADGSLGWIELAARCIADPGAGDEADRRVLGGGLIVWPEAARYVGVLHDLTAYKEAERAAWSKAQQFRLLADNVPVLIAYYEAEGRRCRFANKQYARFFGFDERSILGRPVEEIIGAEAMREVEPYIRRLLEQGCAVAYERELGGADGSKRWIDVSMVPHLDAAGRTIAAFVLLTDITRFRLAERAVRESRERLAKFMQASAEGIVFLNEGLITDANPAACALLGRPLEDLRGRSPFDLVPAEEIAKVAGVMTAGAETTYETVVVRPDGRRLPVECLTRTLVYDGVRTRMGIVRDLSDRRAAQARIHHLAHHDGLTGLANRSAFIERLEHLMSSSRLEDEAFALLFIDLDRFRRVNDSLGHRAGDRLLQTVAARLTESLRASDGVCRFGGDEFLVLLHDVTRHDEVEAVTRKLMAAAEVKVNAAGGSIVVSPSIGIALHPHDGGTAAELIRCAEAAMHEAKRRGRADYRFFDTSLADAAYASLVMESELAQAIVHEEFVLHFQPQVHARSGAIVGAEALIRWQHPGHGLLAPDEFIPLAEQHRLMLPIFRWVLRTAVRRAREWQEGALAGAVVGVNLTSLQFEAGDFVDYVARVLDEEGLPAPLLELELTERMVTADLTSAGATLAKLKALGVRISLDDFGTGYTSLAQLKALPVDRMKIDRSFIADLPHDPKSAAITRAIVQLAQGLGIQVIAEGVETEAQHRLLLEYGCDELQGHAVSEPLDFEQLRAWAGSRRRPPA